MNPRLLFESFCKILPVRCLLLFCFSGGLILITNYASAQTKHLTPSAKVVKVAFVDHSKLRKEYKEFAATLEKLAKEMVAQKKAFDLSLQTLDQQTREQLRLDSLSGGKERAQIISQAEGKRSALTSNYRTDQKKRLDARTRLSQQYEQKIVLAIDRVVSEGGFTDVKPLTKEAPKESGIDITESILKKLN